MLIGVDLDEVLGEFLPAFVEFHNSEYSSSLTVGDFHTYNFYDVFGVSVEEMIRRILESYKSRQISVMLPVFGAKDAVAALGSSGNELVIITARPEESKDETLAWVDRHFPSVFSGVYFTNRISRVGVRRKKADVCHELGIKALIEDDLVHALDCAAKDIKVLLFDRRWNQGKLPDGITRVYSWEQIVGYLNRS